MTRCPNCKHDVLVLARVHAVVSRRGRAAYHLGSLWGDPDHIILHENFQAECNQRGCGWSGTLKDALEAFDAS